MFCAILLWTFSVVFFGWFGGALAFLLLEAALLAVDYLVASKSRQVEFRNFAGTIWSTPIQPPRRGSKPLMTLLICLPPFEL